jgi:hypothetical protein
MTRYERICVWLLGASILTYGCTTTTTGNGEPIGEGAGAIGAGGAGSANGNGNGAVLGGGTAVSSGAREAPGVSIQKAILRSAATCQPENGSSDCTTCLLRNCCTETTACWHSTFCVSLGACMSKCEDDNCVRDCTKQFDRGIPAGCVPVCDADGENCTEDCTDHEEGTPDYQPVLSCANSYCDAFCNYH